MRNAFVAFGAFPSSIAMTFPRLKMTFEVMEVVENVFLKKYLFAFSVIHVAAFSANRFFA